MLLRLIGCLLLLASLMVVGKLIYDSTILEFWTAQWAIGVLSALALITFGLAISFWRSDDYMSILPFFIFGPLYAVVSLVIYCSWGWLHLTGPLTSAAYFGHMVLWLTAGAIGFFSLGAWASDGARIPFRVAAWTYALANLAILLGTTFKYVFLGRQWNFWPFLGEVALIVAGAFVFLKSNDYAEDAPAIRRGTGGTDKLGRGPTPPIERTEPAASRPARRSSA